MTRKKRRAHEAPDPASLAPKASAEDMTLHSRTIGALPIINRFIERCRLRESLQRFLPAEDGRTQIDTATTLLLLLRNILISREPVYGISQWAASFIPELLYLAEDRLQNLNDDRVGRALDRLFDVNLPDLIMTVTRQVVTEFGLDLSELHNDSTSIMFHGEYEAFEESQIRRGKPTIVIQRGHSKEHRSDLKQLLFILTVTDDGGVPVFFTSDDGAKNDDTTHIPTWQILRQLLGTSDFLYVADCKLASNKNLLHIDREGGRFITIFPQNRTSSTQMKQELADNPQSLRWEFLYEIVDENGVLKNQYKTLREERRTTAGYRLLWIHSLTKLKTDNESRIKAISRTTDDLAELRSRMQTPRTQFRKRHKVATAVEKILNRRTTTKFLDVTILEKEEVTLKKATPGRPSKDTLFTRHVRYRYDLTWRIVDSEIERARRTDGVFPLVTNDVEMTAEEILRAYKRQPIIEKRFSQLKTDFSVAPVYLKEVSRIESFLCIYFFALLIQTLLERELRQKMVDNDLPTLPLYHEGRPCSRPTARRVIDAMAQFSRHRLQVKGMEDRDIYTEPTLIQHQLIKLFGMTPETYGRCK